MKANGHVGERAGATGLETARHWLQQQGDAILETQLEIARIPAPQFEERARADRIRAWLKPLDLQPEFDEVGNLIATLSPRKTPARKRPVIVAAHLDTVFGRDTPIEIRRTGGRWIGPGIADNARGLAVVLEVIRALVRTDVKPDRPVVFAFTVGEEGPGNLRGVKHLLRPSAGFREATAFIAVDGTGLRSIVHRGLATRRYRITVSGPGGHSWTDWGRPNPAHLIGDFVHRVARLDPPENPRTTLTVARLGGGTSINAIPGESWCELDLRSETAPALERLDATVRDTLRRTVQAESRESPNSLQTSIRIIGERPPGELPLDHTLVRRAAEATRAIGEEPQPATSSTDANLPLALGIPAIALGGGGVSGNVHTENEWFENRDGAAGAIRILLLLASTAGL